MLLQILEEGKLTDSLGRKIDFRNTVIIMTSNVGADVLTKSAALGFSSSAEEVSAKESDRLLAVAKKYFKPEFINRVDDVVVFRKLEKSDLISIVKLEVEALHQRLQERNIMLKYGDDVLNFLLDKGFEPEYGARPLRRAVERYMEDPLAEELLKSMPQPGTVLEAVCSGNELKFAAAAAPAKRRRRKKEE